MKSKWVQRLLRLLITLLGAGLGVALTLMLVQLGVWIDEPLPLGWIVGLYIATAALGALIFHLLSDSIVHKGGEWAAALETRLDRLSMPQLTGSVLGLICGLLIAALGSQVVGFLGASIFTTALTAILYVFFGAVGLSIGLKRSDDLAQWMLGRLPAFRERRAVRKGTISPARPKLLDASALIDGRILNVAKAGFLEGELIAPEFALDELRRLADSSDASRRARGRRGLDVLQSLQETPTLTVRVERVEDDANAESDVRLLRLAQRLNAAVVTSDFNLNKFATVSGVPVLNVNELASALRPVVAAGEELSAAIQREGKERGQGVAYLEDGTMVVVEGGQQYLGRTVPVVVTSALQTSAGRMVFARLKDVEP